MNYAEGIEWLKANNVTKPDGTFYEFGEVGFDCVLYLTIHLPCHRSTHFNNLVLGECLVCVQTGFPYNSLNLHTQDMNCLLTEAQQHLVDDRTEEDKRRHRKLLQMNISYLEHVGLEYCVDYRTRIDEFT